MTQPEQACSERGHTVHIGDPAGPCNAFLAHTEGRCPGQLLVTSVDDQWVEAQCDRCGTDAAAPTARFIARTPEEQERPDRWWDR